MDHGAYKEMLSALLDGELGGAEREAALAHLAACADCRAYFEELTALRAALDGLEEFDAPEGFAAGVTARLRAGDADARPKAENASTAPKAVKTRAVRRRYAALAACAAVVLLAVYALPNALRMGGGSRAAADNVASGSAVHASPSAAPASPMEASASPAGGAAANGGPAAAAQAPDPGYSYTYTGGDAEGAAQELESARAQETADADAPAAASAGTENGSAGGVGHGTISGGTTTITAGGERYATEDEKLPIPNADDAPMAPLSAPETSGEEYPVLTLSGDGAALWLAENGWQGESGAWYADAAALRALPENLTVVYGELSGDYDGTVLVRVAEP